MDLPVSYLNVLDVRRWLIRVPVPVKSARRLSVNLRVTAVVGSGSFKQNDRYSVGFPRCMEPSNWLQISDWEKLAARRIIWTWVCQYSIFLTRGSNVGRQTLARTFMTSSGVMNLNSSWHVPSTLSSTFTFNTELLFGLALSQGNFKELNIPYGGRLSLSLAPLTRFWPSLSRHAIYTNWIEVQPLGNDWAWKPYAYV